MLRDSYDASCKFFFDSILKPIQQGRDCRLFIDANYQTYFANQKRMKVVEGLQNLTFTECTLVYGQG